MCQLDLFLRPLKGLCSLHMIFYAYHTRNFTCTKHLNVKYLNHLLYSVKKIQHMHLFKYILLWRVTNWFVWLSDEVSPTKPRPSTVCEPMRQHQTNVSGRRCSIVIPFVIVTFIFLILSNNQYGEHWWVFLSPLLQIRLTYMNCRRLSEFVEWTETCQTYNE